MTISFDEALPRLAIAYDDEDAPAGPAGQEPTRPVEKYVLRRSAWW